jgi:hypothetical protein
MHPARLRCENSKYREYSCVFAPGRAGAYTPNSVNLFLREPFALRRTRRRYVSSSCIDKPVGKPDPRGSGAPGRKRRRPVQPAERVGVEPTVPFWSTRHFQCRTFGHSVTSPLTFLYVPPYRVRGRRVRGLRGGMFSGRLRSGAAARLRSRSSSTKFRVKSITSSTFMLW